MTTYRIDVEVRFEIEDLYAEYADVLDTEELERWPKLFVADAFYDVIPRENYERDMPLAIMRCESRAMMQDRVRAIRETLMFEPRFLRHLISSIRITANGSDEFDVTANYAVLETLSDEMTKVLNAGRYVDKLVREDGKLRFKQKRCVYDSSVVPNSLVYPI
ncbi:MAG: Salicylate 5-hydroxylase, small oxygenase component [Alphaproteobacteria bacterium MarineAlpha4_Bin2]|nr:MAG: Salicylate 5-hydroxylase, small oxygenase component [Alphaproteobacteria bacterium MarineAlpha4_Bin2]